VLLSIIQLLTQHLPVAQQHQIPLLHQAQVMHSKHGIISKSQRTTPTSITLLELQKHSGFSNSTPQHRLVCLLLSTLWNSATTLGRSSGMLNLISVFPLSMVLLFNSGSLPSDGTQLILPTHPSLTLFAKATLLVTELNKFKTGNNWLHMVQTILLPTQQIILQLLKLLLTQQLLTSGLMPQVKVKMQPMDSGTLLAKAQDC